MVYDSVLRTKIRPTRIQTNLKLSSFVRILAAACDDLFSGDKCACGPGQFPDVTYLIYHPSVPKCTIPLQPKKCHEFVAC